MSPRAGRFATNCHSIMRASPIHSIYRPHGEGSRFLLFDGELQLAADGTLLPGQIELELYPRAKLIIHALGPEAVSARFADGGEGEPSFVVPRDADLAPPDAAAISKREQVSRVEFQASQIRAGDLARATYLLFHISGALEATVSTRPLAEGGRRPRVNFALPGWELVFVPGTPTYECRDFAAIVGATPTSLPISYDDADRLHRWLFIMLSFLANREVGIGPVCGLDCCGVTWAEWAVPRLNPSKPGLNWCPSLLVPDAMPDLATGLASVSVDPELEVIVDRAIGYSLAANGEEVIEVRIPIVCSGLELLAWAVLQREDWLADEDARRRLGTAASVRLLLKWAGIPTDVPESLPMLAARLRRTGQPGWEGPEILFNLRNAMVHPPRRIASPEWPGSEELFEAWLLGTWYLELSLLRIFDYEGEYWSRVRLNRPAADLEPVPWSA